MNQCTVSKIANFLETTFYGKDFVINKVTALNSVQHRSFSFSKTQKAQLKDIESLILVPLGYTLDLESKATVIFVKNPRLSFAKVLSRFFTKKLDGKIDISSRIGKNCSFQEDLSVGMNCVIGNNVSIGKNTIINHNVVIGDNTTLGDNCYVKSGAIIGEDGFGFDFEEDGTPVRIPHLGNVEIADNVEIGANTVIARATLGSTKIAKNVKIDDHVFIAHNCLVGENTMIIAFAEISGSVVMGENCWIGPNCSVIQKVTIGDNVTVGIGAIVTKNIDAHKKVMGLDALGLRSLLRVKKRISYGE